MHDSPEIAGVSPEYQGVRGFDFLKGLAHHTLVRKKTAYASGFIE